MSLLIIERHDAVALVRLNRPEVLNALSLELRLELQKALEALDAEQGVRAIVITGNDKAFAAGADVNAIKDWSQSDALYARDWRAAWSQVMQCRTPVIAAVAGFAFGAGCELAMMCDFVIAADNAQFAQPEVRLGLIPGAGGTQRLTRMVGKAKAMEMILTGRRMSAAEAEQAGLVARVVPVADLLAEALKTAAAIAAHSAPIVRMAKQAVNAAAETLLAEGLTQEARLFESVFRTADAREGMRAFVEKRKPSFSHQ